MALPLTAIAILVPLLGAFWQFFLSDILFVAYGVARTVQPLSDFPYTCHKIIDPQIEACEDMWLDERSRTLYLACSDVIARTKWMPNINQFNTNGRSLTDHIVAMSIDSPTPSQSFAYTTLKPTGYVGAGLESSLYLVGMTGRSSPDPNPDPSGPDSVDLYLVNAQPSFHPNHTLKHQPTAGGNSTIEVFTTIPGTDIMTHKHTFFNPQIATPNNVAVMPDGSIYFTNDHGLSRSGVMHDLSPLLRTGDVSWCSSPSTSSSPAECKTVASTFSFPNGLHYSPLHNLLFVPSAALGHIYVYRPLPHKNHELEFLEKIHLPYPIDNLSEDREGNIIAAVLPKSGEIFEKFRDPDPDDKLATGVVREMKFGDIRTGDANANARFRVKKEPASAAFTIKRVGKGPTGEKWDVQKLIEDNGTVLPASTTVIRDAGTGRLWFTGVVSEWIAWCEVE